MVISCEQNLIVMSIHYETIRDTFLNVIRPTVAVHDQVFPMLQLWLLLRSVLHLRLRKVLLHVLEHLLHVLESLLPEWKSLTTLHFIIKNYNFKSE